MPRAEQKYLIDRETLEHLLAMLRDGVSRGASDQVISEQVEEILDVQYRADTDQSMKERAEGRIKRFKDVDAMIRDLRVLAEQRRACLGLRLSRRPSNEVTGISVNSTSSG